MLKVEDKLFQNRYRVDADRPHIRVKDATVCGDLCTTRQCTVCCPAGCWTFDDGKIGLMTEADVIGPRVVVLEDLDRPPGRGSCAGEVHAHIFRALESATIVRSHVAQSTGSGPFNPPVAGPLMPTPHTLMLSA